MSDTHPQLWSIQARAFRILYTPFTHNFWVLSAPDSRIISQIHGLAFNPATGTTTAIGNSSCLLLAIEDATISWSLQPNQPTAVCTTGSEGEIFQRWQAAVRALPAINELNLHYPSLWQHFCKKNSNSVFHTIGRILNFPHPERILKTCAPGIHFLLSEDLIEKYRYQQEFQ